MSNNKETEDELPVLSRESYLDKLIADAYSLAEKRIRDGSASSQILNTVLKMGTLRESMELEHIRHKNNLLEAKVEAIHQNAEIKKLYEDAISSFRSYAPFSPEDDDVS